MTKASRSLRVLRFASVSALFGLLGCASSSPSSPSNDTPHGGSGGGGHGGSAVGGSGSGGSGEATATGGSGGSATTSTGGSGGSAEDAAARGDDAATGPDVDASATDDAPVAVDADQSADDAGSGTSGDVNYGKVGELALVPLAYTAQPVPPIIPMDCPDDPTQGFTEYKDSFVVQRPYDLPASARFSYENGIYNEWVMSNDKAHAPGNGTEPRTEVRYSDMKTGEHLWEGDFMLESPSENVCIFQVKGALGAIGVYLRVNGGNMHQLRNGSAGNFLTGIYGKWYHMSVSWDVDTGTGKIWINHCLKETVHGDKGSIWYFKHGTYTCAAGTCRDHFKNIHLYQRNSTDKYNVKSTIP